MYYAVWIIGNEDHKNYGLVGGFITEECYDGDDDGSPMARKTEKELREELDGHILYDSGRVEIIEI